MARTLLTPFKVSEGATAAVALYSATAAGFFEHLTSSGVYIKCGGASRIDPSRLLFIVKTNSSKFTTAARLRLISGSTAGKSDYFPGGYSTLNNLLITIPVASAYKANGISNRTVLQPFMIPDPAKYLDTDEYLKFDCDTDLSSKSAGCSLATAIVALYLSKKGH